MLSVPTVCSSLFTDLADVVEHELEAAEKLLESAAASQLRHTLSNGAPVADSTKMCAFCTLGVSLLEQYAMDSDLSLSQAAANWCTDLTIEMPKLVGVCDLFAAGEILKIQADFNNRVSPDVTCHTTLGYCDGQCSVYSTWPPPSATEEPRVGAPLGASIEETYTHAANTFNKLMNVQTISEDLVNFKIDELMKAGMMPEHLKEKLAAVKGGDWIPYPIPDWDQDRYASTWTYRGVQFRGKDCNDKDATVYPGRDALQGDYDSTVDTNCNGISGIDSESGLPWEKALCAETPSRGILAVGDSATAHFSLPPSWLTPSDFNVSTYSDLIPLLFTEIDWPECSWSTAWGNSTICPQSQLNVSSVYQRMLERNRCMHRDYVNAGVNGASVLNLINDGIVTPANYTGAMKAIPPRYKTDGPSTVFFSMVGNDICHAKELGAWTPVDEFATRVQEEFAYLDTVIAPGSHLIIMGLVDGRVLFDTLANDRHPIGCTYTEFYNFLNCLDICPCWGWMNSNQTVRDASTERAFEYNAFYEQLVENNDYQNFDLHYFFPDYAAIIGNWTASGGDPRALIEPVDGFHPSQTGNMLLAASMWEFLVENVPEAIGDINPNNEEIIAVFGDQGGYSDTLPIIIQK